MGGALFPPWGGRFEIVSGPSRPDFKGADKRKLNWVVLAQGADPRFLINIVEVVSMHNICRSLSVAGSLRPDGSESAVTEAQRQAWLNDRQAYQGRWEPIAFDVREKDVAKGCFLRVRAVGSSPSAREGR